MTHRSHTGQSLRLFRNGIFLELSMALKCVSREDTLLLTQRATDQSTTVSEWEFLKKPTL